MKKLRVLYQIKSLEKLIIRTFLKDMDKQLSLEEFSCPTTPTQMQIIEYILDHEKENIYQKDLEEVLNLRRATVSGVLQTMEKNGLLERVAHTEDARTKRIILNGKAKEIFSQNEKKLEELEVLVTKNISKEELVVFSKVICKMKENLIYERTSSTKN